jgi:hypothetical protein
MSAQGLVSMETQAEWCTRECSAAIDFHALAPPLIPFWSFPVPFGSITTDCPSNVDHTTTNVPKTTFPTSNSDHYQGRHREFP